MKPDVALISVAYGDSAALKPRLVPADGAVMGLWFTKVIEALGGRAGTRQAARDALLAAHQARSKIALESTGGGRTVVAVTTIEQVGDYEIIVNQPAIGGLTHPLAFGEVLNLSFIHNRRHHSGATRCLGRVKIPGGGSTSQSIFAYKLAIPDSLHIEERRADERQPLDSELAVEASLSEPGGSAPLAIGMLTELTMSGARLRCTAPPRSIVPGRELYLKVRLPEPGGVVDVIVDVSHVGPHRGSPETLIGITFRQRIDALEALLREPPIAA